jgi:hypothetical protein
MSIFGILAQGFETAVRRAKLAVYLWLTHLVFGALLVAPLYFIFQKEFSRSLMGGKLLSGPEALWLGDFIFEYQNLGPVFLGWLLVIAVLYAVARIFLNGGVVGRLAAGHGPTTLRDFFESGAEYFWRLARVFLVSVLGYILVFAVAGSLLGLPFRPWMKNASTQWTTLIASALRLLAFLLLFSIVKLFFDYVKVILVAEDKRGALRTTLGSFGFVGRGFFKVWSIFLIAGMLFIAVTAVYLVVGRLLPRSGAIPALALFLWQQVYVFAAGWLGVLFFATEYHYWKAQQVIRG